MRRFCAVRVPDEATSLLPAVVFCLALGLLPGCAYLSNRGRDAHHCVLAGADVGMGVSADAKVGPLGLGVGFSYGACAVGKPTWWSGLAFFEELSIGVPVLQCFPQDAHWPGQWYTYRLVKTWEYEFGGIEKPWGHDFVRQVESRALMEIVGTRLTETRVLSDRYGAIEAGAFLGVVGARLGFNVAEFSDFLLGWCGLDILGDDVHPEEKEPPPAEAPASVPEKAEEKITP